jgi:alpha-mannosidase
VFVNLFNNVWGCNFQQWIGGSWSSRVRIWPVEGNSDEASLLTPSAEARNPCLAVMQDGPAGSLPAEQAGITLSRKGVVVTAFGADPDGINKGTLLRVWEQAGNSGKLVVTGLKAKTATPVNLRGEKTGSSVPIKSGKLTFNLPAFGPASFVLE